MIMIRSYNVHIRDIKKPKTQIIESYFREFKVLQNLLFILDKVLHT